MWSSEVAAQPTLHTIHWAVTPLGDASLLGYAGLSRIDHYRRQGELRVWVCSPDKHSSFAAEWSMLILRFALTRVKLERVYALQLARHPIAGEVLASIGLHREGLLRKRLHRDGPFEDVVCWTILKDDWLTGTDDCQSNELS